MIHVKNFDIFICIILSGVLLYNYTYFVFCLLYFKSVLVKMLLKITKSTKGKDILIHNGFTFTEEKNRANSKVSLKK